MEIQKNCLTIILGPSGAGKSTLVDLICGLYNAENGKILIGKEEIKDINIIEWRQKIGYVSQSAILFNDTIRNNITLYDSTIKDKDIMEALTLSGAIDFIKDRESGLDSIIGEGGESLSGGQKQRLVLARALVKKPELLILDEATTGLDHEVEQRIFVALKKLAKNITIIAITHNKYLIKYADTAFEVKDKKLLKLQIE
jgi:ATP-binding cassette subfamily C protein